MRIGFDQTIQSSENLNLSTSPSLQKGEVYEAKIINIKEGQVTLQMPNGEQIQGQYVSDIPLREGQKILFEFLGLLEGQLNLKIQNLAEQEPFQIQLQNALFENQIPITEKNIELAKILYDNQIPVTKDNIQKLLVGSLKSKEANVEELIFLLKADLEITPENVSQLKTLFNKEQSLQKGFQEIQTLIGQIKDPKILNNLDTSLQKLITVLDGFLELETVLSNQSSELSANRSVPNELPAKAAALLPNELPTQALSSEVLEVEQGVQPKSFVVEPSKTEHLIPVSNDSLKETIHPEQLAASKIKISSEVPLQKENIVLDQLLKHIDISILKEIKPKQLSDLLKMQFLELETVKNIIKEHSFPLQEKILQLIEQTENKMIFLKDLNQNHQVIQIPFSFAQQDYTGNLYVLNKNGHKNLNPEDITAFVSLDTRNIGTIQVYIHKLEKTVSCNFETENYDSLGLIKKYMPKLQTKLNELGYQLQNVTYRVKEEQNTLVDLNMKPSSTQQLSFDKRV